MTSRNLIAVAMIAALGAALGAAPGVALGVALGACGRGPALAEGPADGRAVYDALCATCHGTEGRPPAAMAARLGVRDLTAPELRARITPGLVEQQVRAGSTSKLMPAFEGAIDDAHIRAVAEYVASPQFGQPAAPR